LTYRRDSAPSRTDRAVQQPDNDISRGFSLTPPAGSSA